MREKPIDSEVQRKREIKCGTWVCILKKGDYSWWKKPCRKWSCPECCEIKIEKWQTRILSVIPGPQLFVKQLNKTGRALTQWTQRHVPKEWDYFLVKHPGGAMLITRYKTPGSSRKSKEKFLYGVFGEWLRQTFIGVKRITCRIKNNNQQIDEAKIFADPEVGESVVPVNFGFFLSKDCTDDGREAKEENGRIINKFINLESDLDRGHWLTIYREQVMPFKEGKRLMDEYRKHVENK